MKRILLIANFLFAVQMTFGQQAELLDKSNSDLIDNDLLSVSVDKNGNKWIGTSKFGLVRYDNKSFASFDKTNSNIKGDYISPIFTDTKGNIWVSFSKPTDGIAKYDGSTWTTYSTNEIPVDKISVISIAKDKDGKIYFGGANGLITYDGEKWSTLELPEGNFIIRSLDISDDGVIAIGHNGGLIVKKDEKWTTHTTDNSELQLGTVRAVKYTDSGQLYVGYGGGFGGGGFSIIDGDKWTHFNKTNSKVPDHMVRDIEIGKNGVIWMATNNGVIKKEGKTITPILFREGMFQNTILDIAIENETVWIATNFGLIKIK